MALVNSFSFRDYFVASLLVMTGKRSLRGNAVAVAIFITDLFTCSFSLREELLSRVFVAVNI